jgi:hypothetical protein
MQVKSLMEKLMKMRASEEKSLRSLCKNGFRWDAESVHRGLTAAENTVRIAGCKGGPKSIKTELEARILQVSQEMIDKAALSS